MNGPHTHGKPTRSRRSTRPGHSSVPGQVSWHRSSDGPGALDRQEPLGRPEPVSRRHAARSREALLLASAALTAAGFIGLAVGGGASAIAGGPPAGMSSGGMWSGGAAGPSGMCPGPSLTLSSTRPDPGAGNIFQQLVLTNTGPAACWLQGFPQVSFVGDNGQQVGAPAAHIGPTGPVVFLKPGESARAVLHTVQPGLQVGCDQQGETAPVRALKVHPPGSMHSLSLGPPAVATACTSTAIHQMDVTTVIIG
ncbi:hypothetical protein Franean1_3513 [Parafrankia sp. EAN1pec]|nr:hypothetical protein Franean1_3513 [Frankia sp. EAN1pec]